MIRPKIFKPKMYDVYEFVYPHGGIDFVNTYVDKRGINIDAEGHGTSLRPKSIQQETETSITFVPENPHVPIADGVCTLRVSAEPWAVEYSRNARAGMDPMNEIRHGSRPGVTREKLPCARDFRWHSWCVHCDMCVGHGTVTGLQETPPHGCVCSVCDGDTKLIDTEAREDHVAETDTFITREVTQFYTGGSFGAVFRRVEGPGLLLLEMWRDGEWKHHPDLMAATGIGGDTSYEQIDEEEAKRLMTRGAHKPTI